MKDPPARAEPRKAWDILLTHEKTTVDLYVTLRYAATCNA